MSDKNVVSWAPNPRDYSSVNMEQSKKDFKHYCRSAFRQADLGGSGDIIIEVTFKLRVQILAPLSRKERDG